MSDKLDIENLKALADHAMTFAVNFLREHKEFQMMFQLHSDSGIDVVQPKGLPPEADEVLAKKAISRAIRQMIEERQAYAVAHMSDAYMIAVPDSHPLRHLAESGDYSTKELERMGIAKRREALIVCLETPTYKRIVQQFYYRNGDGEIILRERKEMDSTHPDWSAPAGRFFIFFDEPKAAHA